MPRKKPSKESLCQINLLLLRHHMGKSIQQIDDSSRQFSDETDEANTYEQSQYGSQPNCETEVYAGCYVGRREDLKQTKAHVFLEHITDRNDIPAAAGNFIMPNSRPRQK